MAIYNSSANNVFYCIKSLIGNLTEEEDDSIYCIIQDCMSYNNAMHSDFLNEKYFLSSLYNAIDYFNYISESVKSMRFYKNVNDEIYRFVLKVGNDYVISSI